MNNKSKTLPYRDLANCIRVLSADAIEKASSGHPGMPLGLADVMTILVFNFLKFNPNDPKWFNRDRLVLSNGHGSMLLYSFYYLTGYLNFSIDDIKNFRQLHSKTPGHPEYHVYEAIEATTGPLGQGFGMSVGMAIAQKKYQYKLSEEVCNYKIYCFVGDGCLMEGISYEAAALAGHLRLNNLIVLFDDNHITIDGDTNLATSEDQIAKFKALGFSTYKADGHDYEEITKVLNKAQNSKKPVFIAFRTIIGKGTKTKENSELSHGAPLGKEEISWLKEQSKFKDEPFFIPEELFKIWCSAWQRNEANYLDYRGANNNYLINEDHLLSLANSLTKIYKADIPVTMPTRVCSGKVIYELMRDTDLIIAGSSDLSFSNNIKNSNSQVIRADNFSGNFIHYGVREQLMAAVMNGLALTGFIPIGGTFLSFSDYMKAGIRLSSMMKQKVIYIMTHDSIGLGEDGPTHQPVEQIASLRSIPDLLVLRPADMIEVIECYQIALKNNGPVVLILTRQAVPTIRSSASNENLVEKGAYILRRTSSQNNDVSIWATGSEVSLALSVAEILEQENIKIQVISIPSFEIFFSQSENYIKSLQESTPLHVGIEAACSFGWDRVIGQSGKFFGVEKFGLSAPYEQVYKEFLLTKEHISEEIRRLIQGKKN